jgi:hypothetical protein
MGDGTCYAVHSGGNKEQRGKAEDKAEMGAVESHLPTSGPLAKEAAHERVALRGAPVLHVASASCNEGRLTGGKEGFHPDGGLFKRGRWRV